VEHKVEEASSLAHATEASTRDAIIMMQTQVAALAARCTAAEERAGAAEAVAADLRVRLEAAVRDNERVARDADRQARDADRRASGLSEALRESQAQMHTALMSGLAAVNAPLDRALKDIAAQGATLAALEKATAALRASTGEADAALARDVAMLAEAAAAARTASAAEAAAAGGRVAGVVAAAEEARRADADDRDRRLAALSKSFAAEVDALRRAVEEVGRDTRTARSALDDHSRAAAVDARTTSTAFGSLEASVAGQLAEQGRRLEDTTRTTTARLDAMSSALHAFANVLHLGQIVVDPKTVLARSLAATGAAAGTPLSATMPPATPAAPAPGPAPTRATSFASPLRAAPPASSLPSAAGGAVGFGTRLGAAGPSNMLIAAAYGGGGGGGAGGAAAPASGSFGIPLSSSSYSSAY